MKKTISKFAVVVTLAFITSNAMAAAFDPNVLCPLFEELGGVFEMLRTLAFGGAGFIIAGWAWGYINDGGKNVKLDDAKTKGLGMLVGFMLLFSIGAIIQVFLNMAGDNGSLDCMVNMW